MAGVAIEGSSITDTIKANHVRYTIENWVDYYGGDPDADPPIPPRAAHWGASTTSSTGAKITGEVATTTAKLKIAGDYIALVGDSTNEQWIDYPEVPSSTSDTRYTAITPTSGSSNGEITSGSSKVFLGGKAVALVGSTVNTCLDTTATISSGNSKFNVAG
ncbi:hypothetical protein K0T92_04935 [Paenibacillus oenotherae]|uniref:Uncharacterized protein n=1 Tax=Paenibacillus oenotherae TaxID=1435645 RepID=A0ABS7D2E6_9BACL|nr:PAAR domain-containing protein [Paenibacillus oenotherae]MBW7474078.1 hypothetical protein [Paenibacillus oenotherae]